MGVQWTSSLASDEDPWVFGYGSLVWRPGFSYLERSVAVLPGWQRRFWQGSTDHRGVPGAPGRVVTLERASADSVCGGVAYRLDSRKAPEVLSALDVREQGGYELLREPCILEGGTTIEALVYIATPVNQNYLGEASPEELVEQILGARGPSGKNACYVLELAAELDRLGIEDGHVAELALALKEALL